LRLLAVKIRTRLYLGAAISIVLGIVLVFAVVLSSNRITQETEKHNVVMDINTAILELDLVTYEYLLHREKRMEQQWKSRYSSMAEILEKAEEKEVKLTESIHADFTSFGDLFSQVTINYKERQELIQRGASQEKIGVAILLEERLVAQLLIKSQSMVTDTSRLAERSYADAIAAQKLARNLALILTLVLAITVTTASLLIARSISKPLSRLAEYARGVGDGEYTAEIEIKGRDEVASVASDVKTMVEQLQQVQEEISFSEKRYRGIFDSAGEAIVTFDTEDVIQSWNQAAEEMLGYKEEEAIGRTFYFLVPENLRGELEHFRKEAVVRGRITRFETKRIRKDGTAIEVELTRSVLRDDEGNITGFMGLLNDITERKQMQEQLLASERLATLGQFSGNISHELRNPLGVIGSSVYYLKTKLKDADEKTHEHLDRIKQSVDGSTAIIESLLSLTRMKEPQLEEFDLVAVAHDAITTTKVSDTVEVIRNFPEQEVMVSADREQLRMAFKNIVKNAGEAMDGGGTLTVTVHTATDGQSEVSFADTGSGIALENLDRVFQPLFSTKASGIGFGLSIAKMVIDKHGGTIEAKSEPGKGATFIARLPLYA